MVQVSTGVRLCPRPATVPLAVPNFSISLVMAAGLIKGGYSNKCIAFSHGAYTILIRVHARAKRSIFRPTSLKRHTSTSASDGFGIDARQGRLSLGNTVTHPSYSSSDDAHRRV